MDVHSIDLSGRVDWWKFDAPTATRPYGQISIRTVLERDTLQRAGMDTVLLDQQTVFLSIKLNQKHVGKKHLNHVLQVLQAGEAHFLCTDGKIKSWKKDGKERRSLEFSLANANVYGSSLPTQVNLVRLFGRCHWKKDHRMIVRESYRIPGKEGPEAWKERHIPVSLPSDVKVGSGTPVYVQGRLAGKTPAGESDIYVIASFVA